MKHLILFVAVLLSSSNLVLRGLKGVRLIVMSARADAIEEAKRPEILKAVESDAKARPVKAEIPLLTNSTKWKRPGSPTLTVIITCDGVRLTRPLVWFPAAGAESIYRSHLAIQSGRNEVPFLSQADSHQRLVMPVLRVLV